MKGSAILAMRRIEMEEDLDGVRDTSERGSRAAAVVGRVRQGCGSV
jgi:hypothetical protein